MWNAIEIVHQPLDNNDLLTIVCNLEFGYDVLKNLGMKKLVGGL